MGDLRQVREGGADAAVPRGDPRGHRTAGRARQERHDDAVQAHARQGQSRGPKYCMRNVKGIQAGQES